LKEGEAVADVSGSSRSSVELSGRPGITRCLRRDLQNGALWDVSGHVLMLCGSKSANRVSPVVGYGLNPRGLGARHPSSFAFAAINSGHMHDRGCMRPYWSWPALVTLRAFFVMALAGALVSTG